MAAIRVNVVIAAVNPDKSAAMNMGPLFQIKHARDGAGPFLQG